MEGIEVGKMYQNATQKNTIKTTRHFMDKWNLIFKFQITLRHFKAFQSMQHNFYHFGEVYINVEIYLFIYLFYFKNI